MTTATTTPPKTKPATKPKSDTPCYKEADLFFSSVKPDEISFQTNYWSALKPLNDSERFQRFLFAFMSVHTSWKSNISGYKLIKNWWEWINNWTELENRIKQSGAGLYNNRVRFIKDFCTKYWSNPSFYQIAEGETWTGYRNRIEQKIIGLGMAKTSFGVEMLYPAEGQVVCLDTHLFQLYGLDQRKDVKLYQCIEKHWIDCCDFIGVAPYVARCIYWDRKQGYNDSRYWSYVLEEGDFADELGIGSYENKQPTQE